MDATWVVDLATYDDDAVVCVVEAEECGIPSSALDRPGSLPDPD
jgi:hypothetical protein